MDLEDQGPQIEILEDEPSSRADSSSRRRSKPLLLENGDEKVDQDAKKMAENTEVADNSLALVPHNGRSSTAASGANESGLSLFTTAVTLVSWMATAKKTDSNSSKRQLKTSQSQPLQLKDAPSPQNSETDEDDVEKPPNSSSSVETPPNSAAVAQGVLDVLLLVRQSIQRISQLSWGLRTSFHTSNIDEGDFDAFVVLCSIYEAVGVTCASDLLIRLRRHRTRLAQLLKRHIGSMLSCILVLQRRIVDEQKSLPGMSLVYRHLEAIVSDFEMDLDSLLTNFKQMRLDCGKMKDGIIAMPLSQQQEDNTGVSAAMYAYNSINALATRVGGQDNKPSAAILSHGEYMRQMSSQMDLHWNSIGHLVHSLKSTLESVGAVSDRLREYSKDTNIIVPQQQIDYIFEFNYDGFFRQSTKDLETLLSTFDVRRP
ncbi:hypothetical protein PINS_up022666 [Pythium insidiosum]|nr:hypothetical protein PINS_up022666 [Pythium insidiosum]